MACLLCRWNWDFLVLAFNAVFAFNNRVNTSVNSIQLRRLSVFGLVFVLYIIYYLSLSFSQFVYVCVFVCSIAILFCLLLFLWALPDTNKDKDDDDDNYDRT